MTVGNNIKTQRRKIRLSQEEVARRLHVSAQTVSDWESERAEPSVGNLMALARMFRISYDRLVDSGKKKISLLNQYADFSERYQ